MSEPTPDNAHCPLCHAQLGRPQRVTVGHSKRVITYKCEKCGHEWIVERTEPPPRLK